jgi:2-dehydropantoate 2-reductase
MNVLVYGAGVIGCYLTHVLCAAGNDVTLLARGTWKRTLERNGLTIRHHLQRKITTDHPEVVEEIDFTRHYDMIFSVVSYHQVDTILDDLAKTDTDIVVLVGNNLSAPQIENYIHKHSAIQKKILFGFQVTAGKRENSYVVCERLGGGEMHIGYLSSPVQDDLKRKFEELFNNTNYKLRWYNDMDSFLKCHAAAILPIAYLAYICECDYRKSTKEQRKLYIDASAEGYDMLLKSGYSVIPKGDDKYYRHGAKRLIWRILMYIVFKTEFGELMAAAHCRHSVSEMERLDKAWNELRRQVPDISMPNWDKMYDLMPDWEDVHDSCIKKMSKILKMY